MFCVNPHSPRASEVLCSQSDQPLHALASPCSASSLRQAAGGLWPQKHKTHTDWATPAKKNYDLSCSNFTDQLHVLNKSPTLPNHKIQYSVTVTAPWQRNQSVLGIIFTGWSTQRLRKLKVAVLYCCIVKPPPAKSQSNPHCPKHMPSCIYLPWEEQRGAVCPNGCTSGRVADWPQGVRACSTLIAV